MNKRQQIIEVLPYNPSWPKQFAEEAKAIGAIFGELIYDIHHIGSTAIANMPAKPTIDILLAVNDIDAVDSHNEQMAKLGYEAWGEYDIPGRRFFIKGNDRRTHHVHTFDIKSHEIDRHLKFRDYLIAHPKLAQQYADLKSELAKKYRHNRKAYVQNKTDFVKMLEDQAIKFYEENK